MKFIRIELEKKNHKVLKGVSKHEVETAFLQWKWIQAVSKKHKRLRK